MVPLLTQLLGLPGLDVEAYEETGNELMLSVERHEKSASPCAKVTRSLLLCSLTSIVINLLAWPLLANMLTSKPSCCSGGAEVLAHIEEVSIDLSGNYRGLVHRLLPDADIVADRFHVMQLVNQELNRARSAFIRKLTHLPEGVTVEVASSFTTNSPEPTSVQHALIKPLLLMLDFFQHKW